MRVLVIVLAMLWYRESAACMFAPESVILDDPAAAMEWADAVFSATVVSQELIERKATSRATIEVHDVWKGDVASLRALDNYLGSTCSRPLSENGRYIFFASSRGKRWHVTGTFVGSGSARGVVEVLSGLEKRPDARP
jgi:hypothetical protein